MPGYSQHVAWSPEDGQYVAVCPELEDLMALADTEEEAVSELKIAIGLAVEDMVECGDPLPEPAVRGKHSGQFRVRLPRSLHGRLVHQAYREKVSLNALVCTILAEGSAQWAASSYVSRQFRATYDAVLSKSTDLAWSSGWHINDSFRQAAGGELQKPPRTIQPRPSEIRLVTADTVTANGE